MALVRVLGFLIAVYCLIVFIFFLNESEKKVLDKLDGKEEKEGSEKILRRSYLRANKFIIQFVKDCQAPSKDNAPFEVDKIIAYTLFEAVGKKFSAYENLEQMNFSFVDFTKGYYEFSFRLISSTLEQDASLIKDLTAETVKDCFAKHGYFPADAVVMLQKIGNSVAIITVSCANNEEMFKKLQIFKQRLANIEAKNRVDLVSGAVDEELEKDLGGL